ncbi:MAG: DUF1800 domain-containing protein [Planctomycetota bacterium]
MLNDFDKAAHLWRRAGFGATTRQIIESAENGLDRAIDDFLDLDRGDGELEKAIDTFAGDTLDLNNNIDDARVWWLYRMIHTRRPLREKLTLFWHGHFATSVNKVERAASMLRQNQTLRKFADAPFSQILLEISKDPAMLAWLDGNANKKGKPNENFARELLELFSLGIGNYIESDVRDAARAFTGWGTADYNFRIDAKQHDNGEKTVLGRKGKLDGADVISAISEHPAALQFLALKLCRFFVNDHPAPAYVDRVADAYRRSGGHVRAMIEAIFRDPEFFAEENVRSIIKSPADFVVSSIRTLGVRLPIRNLLPYMKRMGQSLFAPPSVKGWEGGAAWLTSSALFERNNFAMFLASTRGMPEEPRYDPAEWIQGRAFEDAGDFLNQFAFDILHIPPSAETRAALLQYLRPERDAKAGQGMMSMGQDKVNEASLKSAGGFRYEPRAFEIKARGAARLLLSSPEFQLA